MTIPFKYTLFALLASLCNLIAQFTSLMVYNGHLALYVAMFWGTAAGLILKYILDKKYIFCYQTKDFKADFLKFFMYSLMGVFTTMIFWGFELFFNHVMAHESAKYIGAVIGLVIGYTTKYILDKKFVFIRS